MKGNDVVFRFDANAHEYILGDEVRPHITGMLQATGWIDDRWYTEESSTRGQAVHRLTADYDLGALEVASCRSAYRGWLLGHVKMVSIARPTWTHIEEPLMSARYGFGGRPDRAGVMYQLEAVNEIKSGGVEKAHAIQLALQAILRSEALGIPPEGIARFAEYLKDNGKFTLVRHEHRRDFDVAYDIIRQTCR